MVVVFLIFLSHLLDSLPNVSCYYSKHLINITIFHLFDNLYLLVSVCSCMYHHSGTSIHNVSIYGTILFLENIQIGWHYLDGNIFVGGIVWCCQWTYVWLNVWNSFSNITNCSVSIFFLILQSNFRLQRLLIYRKLTVIGFLKILNLI